MRRRILSLSMLFALGVAALAGASTFVAMDEEQLVAASAAVVRGRVVSVESFWNDAHTLILTEAVLEVEETLAGEAPLHLTVRTAGGTVDDYTVDAHGFPRFAEGERALLFLERDDARPLGRVSGRGRPDPYRVTGYQLGHYRILHRRDGAEIAVPTVDAGGRLVAADGREVAGPRARLLTEFEAELRRLGAEGGVR